MSSDILRRIKRAVLLGNYAFSEKALIEMEADSLTELDVAESILNAVAIYKTIRSRSTWRQQRIEYLHVIQSTNLDGLMIYTKGKMIEEAGVDRYYLTYVVPELTFYECPVCGERVFPPEAMMKIEVHSPAYTRYSRKVSRSGAAKAVPASSSVER